MADLVCDGSGNIAVSEIIDAINDNSDRLGAWDSNIEYEVGAFIYSANDGFYYQALVTNTGSQPVVGNDNWQRWSPVNWIETDRTLTVGSAGDFATLQIAFNELEKWQIVGDAVLTIQILAGHIIDYDIKVTDMFVGSVEIVPESGTFDIDVSSTTTYKIDIQNVHRVSFIGDFNVYGTFANSGSGSYPSVFNFSKSTITIKSDSIAINNSDLIQSTFSFFIINGDNVSIMNYHLSRCSVDMNNMAGFSLAVGGFFKFIDVTGNSFGTIFYAVDNTTLTLQNCVVRSTDANARGILSRELSSVVLRGQTSDYRTSGATESRNIVIEEGGLISAYDTNNSIIGGSNVTPNTVSAAGIFFL